MNLTKRYFFNYFVVGGGGFFTFCGMKKIITKMEIRFLEILNLLLLQSTVISLKLAFNKPLFGMVKASEQLVLG